MASSTTVAIIATSITVCVIPVGAGSSKTLTTASWRHGGRSRGSEPARFSVSRVNGLSTLSKLHGVDKRTESHRDQIIAVNNKITSIMAGDAAQTRVHAMALASIPPGEERCFQGAPRSPSSDGRCVCVRCMGGQIWQWQQLSVQPRVRRVCSSRGEWVNTTFQYVAEGWTTHWRSSRGGLNKSLRSSMSPATTDGSQPHLERQISSVNWLSGHHGESRAEHHDG
jgi:hypothetical protein